MLIVIPARYASTRFPGKPLAPLLGKPLIQWTWEAAARVPDAEVVIATDDDRIQAAAEGFGASVIRTSAKCRNGTERVAEAVANMPWHRATEVVVNWQGDAPLLPPHIAIAAARDVLRRGAAVVTPGIDIVGVRGAGGAGHVEMWLDSTGRVLWFSREPVLGGPYVAHVGLYAYSTPALLDYPTWRETEVERCTGLEQLRWLSEDKLVTALLLHSPPLPEVNYPEDIPVVEAILRSRGAQ